MWKVQETRGSSSPLAMRRLPTKSENRVVDVPNAAMSDYILFSCFNHLPTRHFYQSVAKGLEAFGRFVESLKIGAQRVQDFILLCQGVGHFHLRLSVLLSMKLTIAVHLWNVYTKNNIQ
jgi:hypothetical protein